jgi:hypothetical protein
MKRLALITIACAAALLLAASAQGESRRVGNLIVSFNGHFAPHKLPRDREVPVTVDISGALKTVDGEAPPPLRSMSFAVDRHGRLSTRGLPVCAPGRLESTSSDEALSRCRSALVGRGSFGANVDFPDLEFPVEGRMLAFSSRARARPAIALHIYGANPVKATFVLILHIRHPAKGAFGTVLTTRIPKLAADLGYVTDFSLSFGRRYRHRGEPRSFISARCAAPAGFPGALFNFVRGSFAFANGKTVTTTVTRDCVVRQSP